MARRRRPPIWHRFLKKLDEIVIQLAEIRKMLELVIIQGIERQTEEVESISGVPVVSPFEICFFWITPKPGEPPFVKEGDHVEEGRVLCLLEIAKTFNKIESPVTGTIVRILYENETEVEGENRVLIIIEPDDKNDPRIVALSGDELVSQEEAAPEPLILSDRVGFVEAEKGGAVLVEVGDIVNEGSKIIIVMVLSTYCEVQYHGPGAKIVEVLVKDGDVVEYGQPIARIGFVESVKEE